MQSIWSTMAFLWSFCYVVVEDVELFLLHHQEEIVRLHIFMEIRITSTQWNLKDIWQSTDTLSKCMVVWVVCISLSKIWTPTGGVVGRLFYKKEKWFKDMKTKNNNKKDKKKWQKDKLANCSMEEAGWEAGRHTGRGKCCFIWEPAATALTSR